jgi:hypothetical protein
MMKLALIASAALMLQACTPGLAPDSTGYEPEFPSHGSAPATPSPCSGSDPGGEVLDLGGGSSARVVYALRQPRDEGARVFVREGSCWREVYSGFTTREVRARGSRGLLLTVGLVTEAGVGRATVFAKYVNGRYRTEKVVGCELEFEEPVQPIPQAECETLVERYATP